MFKKLLARGPVVRFIGRSVEVWDEDGWRFLVSFDELFAGSTENGRMTGTAEVEGLCALLKVGQFVRLDRDGTWSLANITIGRYAKTERPRRDLRLW